tara:strand:- start:453 stop:1301 length:849 start_codon:yes stop_codon:yes gene_type:complete
MVRTSTIIVIVMCTCLIAGGGLGTYYFRSTDDAALNAEEIMAAEAAAKELELAEERAAAVRANAPIIRTAAQLAQEKLEIAKAEAGASKYATDIGKQRAETKLITAVRALEEAEARLQEAMTDSTISDARRLEAQLDVDAAKIDVDAAAEVVRIQERSQADADEIKRLSDEAILALEAEIKSAVENGDEDAAEIARQSIAKIEADTEDARLIAVGLGENTALMDAVTAGYVEEEGGIRDEVAAGHQGYTVSTYRIRPENREMCSRKRVFVDGRIGINVTCSK